MRVPTVIAPAGSSGCTACAAAISIMPIIAGVESTGGRRQSIEAMVHSRGTTRCTAAARPMRGFPEFDLCGDLERVAFLAWFVRLRDLTRRFIAQVLDRWPATAPRLVRRQSCAD